MIEGRLHEAHRIPTPPGLFLLEQNLHPLTPAQQLDGFAHMYALTHCTKTGTTPTPNEYLQALCIMEDYVEEPQNATRWVHLGDLATRIDETSPSGRVWSFMCTMFHSKKWKEKDGRRIPHPRRHCINPSQRAQIRAFVLGLRERLLKLPVASRNQPTPWSISYVGYTGRSPEARLYEHSTHDGLSTCVKYLMEAVMAIEVAPQTMYFMHHKIILAITDHMDVGVAEYAVSLLCSSYVHTGRLNGTLAGGGGLIEQASNLADGAFVNSARHIESQQILSLNTQKFEVEVRGREVLQKRWETSRVLENYDQAVVVIDEARKDEEVMMTEIVARVSVFASTKKEEYKTLMRRDKAEADIQILDSIDLDF